MLYHRKQVVENNFFNMRTLTNAYNMVEDISSSITEENGGEALEVRGVDDFQQ